MCAAWWDCEGEDGCNWERVMVGDRSMCVEALEECWRVRTWRRWSMISSSERWAVWRVDGSAIDSASSCRSRSSMRSSCCFLSAICLWRKQRRVQAALVVDWGVRFQDMLRNLIWREMDLSLDLERGARGMNGGKSGMLSGGIIWMVCLSKTSLAGAKRYWACDEADDDGWGLEAQQRPEQQQQRRPRWWPWWWWWLLLLLLSRGVQSQ